MGTPSITAEVADVDPDFSGTIYDYSLPGRAQPALRVAVRLPALPQRDADVGQRGAAARPRGRVRRLDAGPLPRVARERLPPYGGAFRRRQAVRLHQRVERMGRRGASRTRPRAMATPTCKRQLTRFASSRRRPTVDSRRVSRRVFPRRPATGAGAGEDALAVAGIRRGDAARAAAARSRPTSSRSAVCTSSPPPGPRWRLDSGSRATCSHRGARLALCNTSVVGGTVELPEAGRIPSRIDDSRAARADRSARSRELDRLHRATCRSGCVPGPHRPRSLSSS